MGEQTFKSVRDALVFAFRFSSEAYERPLMNRMADDPVRTAKAGLGGLDGAGQAGMIWNQVCGLPDLQQFVLYAAYGPRVTQCSCGHNCCQGWARNPCWEACIVKIEEAAITQALAGCLTNRTLRRGIVRRLFGDREIPLETLAKRSGTAARTASTHNQLIKTWLFGSKQDPHPTGVKPKSEARMEHILLSCGLVEKQFT